MEFLDTTEYKMKTSLRTTLEKIKKSKYGLAEIASQHHLNGTFKALCDEKSFAELLFPGIPLEQRNILPKNLREVIIWSELILDENDIVKKASSVLTNIKLKGEKVGDIMDLTTEMVLLPQITQEALGKAVVDGIRNLNRRISNMSAHVSAVIASTEAKEAQFDQLEPDVTDDLLVAAEEHSSSSNSSGFGIQDDYMGEDWIGLILSDVKRYAKDEKLSYVDSAGAAVVSEGVRKIAGSSPELQVSWLENNQAMQEKYPALAELVQQLHALPFEINLKWLEKQPKWQLLEPAKGCTLFVRVPPGGLQMIRLDSRSDDSDLDSGIRITCTYFIKDSKAVAKGNEAVKDSGVNEGSDSMNLYTSAGEKTEIVKSIPIVNDRLVLHQSTELKNSRSPATEEYFAILYFIQGKQSTSK